MSTTSNYDYLDNLTPAEMASAQLATLAPIDKPLTGVIAEYESRYFYFDTAEKTLSDNIFCFTATAGAKYSISSSSFFDPYVLIVYDSHGKPIAVDDGSGSYGSDSTDFVASTSGTYYIGASWHQGFATGHTGVSLSIWEDLDGGTAPWMWTYGSAGNDVFTDTFMNDGFDGGAGVDTLVLYSLRSRYEVKHGRDGSLKLFDLKVDDSVDTLKSIERIRFADSELSFETSGISAQAYRLYQAALHRAPDADGLGFHIKHLKQGMSLHDVATGFTNSKEFAGLYGDQASYDTIIQAFYRNVLDREPEPAGYEYWMNKLTQHQIDIPGMLVAFSESAENVAKVVGSLEAGYEYTLL